MIKLTPKVIDEIVDDIYIAYQRLKAQEGPENLGPLYSKKVYRDMIYYNKDAFETRDSKTQIVNEFVYDLLEPFRMMEVADRLLTIKDWNSVTFNTDLAATIAQIKLENPEQSILADQVAADMAVLKRAKDIIKRFGQDREYREMFLKVAGRVLHLSSDQWHDIFSPTDAKEELLFGVLA